MSAVFGSLVIRSSVRATAPRAVVEALFIPMATEVSLPVTVIGRVPVIAVQRLAEEAVTTRP